jgi:hypothetical protein
MSTSSSFVQKSAQLSREFPLAAISASRRTVGISLFFPSNTNFFAIFEHMIYLEILFLQTLSLRSMMSPEQKFHGEHMFKGRGHGAL